MLRIWVSENYEALSLASAGLVAERLRAKPDTVFLVPTGVTPLRMYRRLAELHAEEGLSFAQATFFNLDEYLGLPPDHPASYRVYMEENFYAFVDTEPERIHVPEGSTPDPEAECERYEAAIREAGGVDLCVLGIGRNGHIGFNEPGSHFASRTRVVWLAESTRQVNAADFEENRAPERAITVGMATIFEAREVLLLASGANKARAVAAGVEGEISDAVPASLLRRHPNVTFLLDRDAASALKKGAA
jgi:glucosamine-6-phosphate deaminase